MAAVADEAVGRLLVDDNFLGVPDEGVLGWSTMLCGLLEEM